MLWLIIIEWVSRLVLLLLIVLSIWSIAIIIERYKFFKNLELPFEKFKKLIKEREYVQLKNESMKGTSLIDKLIQSFYFVNKNDQIEKCFEVFCTEERQFLEKGVPILGTLGAVTPFIGLLGTILGIIVSFGELSQGSVNTNSVMFSLAEALTLTAVGLVVAIPAVISFNIYSRKIRTIYNELASIKDLYLGYKD